MRSSERAGTRNGGSKSDTKRDREKEGGSRLKGEEENDSKRERYHADV